MKDDPRACRLALGLGPCADAASLEQTDPTPQSLCQLWPRRLAHAFWQQASDPDDLLARSRLLLRSLKRQGARLVLATDAAYPRRLRRLQDAPAVLFLRGAIPDGPTVAMVGSRAAFREGCRRAREAAADLAQAGVAVVSGGAIGVDSAAHEGALDGGGQTVVFLGSGLDRPYPERNLELFSRVAGQGAVVSSFAPGTPPLRGCFPRRNRLIAALADVVVVVEAGRRSGALQTARWAERLGVPGLAGDTSPGARWLLGQGAGLFGGADDARRALRGEPPRHARPAPEGEDQRTAVDCLGERPLTVDQLARRLGWSAPRAALVLVGLQVAGLVSLEPGGRYARVGLGQRP